MDFAAEAAALNLAQFSDAEKRGSADTKVSGNVGRVFGIDWYGEDAIQTHTAGTASTIATNGSAYDVGVNSITMTYGTPGTGMLVGDVFTIAGDDQTYVVSATKATAGAVTFTPGLKVALAASVTVVTPKGDHVVNIAFHRDAFGLAMRAPDAGIKELFGATTGNVLSSVTLQDPVSKLVMRLELIRGYKMTIWDVDCLWGTSLVDAAKACRLAG